MQRFEMASKIETFDSSKIFLTVYGHTGLTLQQHYIHTEIIVIK